MAGIDLREIRFRTNHQGDDWVLMNQNPVAASETFKVSLAGIKFRSEELSGGDSPEPDRGLYS